MHLAWMRYDHDDCGFHRITRSPESPWVSVQVQLLLQLLYASGSIITYVRMQLLLYYYRTDVMPSLHNTDAERKKNTYYNINEIGENKPQSNFVARLAVFD